LFLSAFAERKGLFANVGDAVFNRKADAVEFNEGNRQRRHDDDDIAKRAEPDAFVQGVLTNAKAAFFIPGVRLFCRAIADDFDSGDQAALANVADVWVVADAG